MLLFFRLPPSALPTRHSSFNLQPRRSRLARMQNKTRNALCQNRYEEHRARRKPKDGHEVASSARAARLSARLLLTGLPPVAQRDEPPPCHENQCDDGHDVQCKVAVGGTGPLNEHVANLHLQGPDDGPGE